MQVWGMFLEKKGDAYFSGLGLVHQSFSKYVLHVKIKCLKTLSFHWLIFQCSQSKFCL